MVTQVQTVETRTEAMRRLLDVARESGVRLGMDSDGDMWATSVSEPGLLYPVTPESCGCRGFATHRRCRHVAALWSYLGYLDPEPTPPATTLSESDRVLTDSDKTAPSCPTCHGKGEIHDTELFRGRRCDIWLHCTRCSGTGHLAAAA